MLASTQSTTSPVVDAVARISSVGFVLLIRQYLMFLLPLIT